MNAHGKLALEILIILVVMVFTSALILVLVKSGVIDVKSDVAAEPVLNAEFLPLGRMGNVAITDFEFCSFVDEEFNCLNVQDEFKRDGNVYVRFIVESSTYQGDILLLRNYQIKDPAGEIVLQVDQRNRYTFEVQGGEESERIVFADFFTLDEDAPPGEYTLDIIVENTLLDKKVILSKKFMVVE